MQSIPKPLSPAWRALEAYFQRRYGIRTLEDDPAALLAYNLFEYRGPEVALRDGTRVRSGDTVMELHFRREALAPLMADGDAARMGLGLIKLGDRDMPRLAHLLARDPALRDVKALHALTLFHRGIPRWGFEVLPVTEWWVERWFTWWHRLLLARDHAHGAGHVREHREKLVTRHVWLSREALLARYGSNA
jgi:peptidoglycan-N-acetylglucosamine deacetylase